MPLIVNLRHLEEHNVRLGGELPVDELDLDPGDEMIRAAQPLQYDFEVQKLEGGLLVRGSLRLIGLPLRPVPETLQARAGIEGMDVPFAAGRRGRGSRGQ